MGKISSYIVIFGFTGRDIFGNSCTGQQSQYIPEVVVVRRGAVGVLGGGKGGWVNWVKGYKRGQFTDNLGPRWTNPVTSGGSQVSGRGHKGELEGVQGEQGEQGRMRHVYMLTQCVCQSD